MGEAREPPPGAMEEDDLFQQLLQEQSMEMEGPPQGGSEQRSGEVLRPKERIAGGEWRSEFTAGEPPLRSVCTGRAKRAQRDALAARDTNLQG